MKAIQKIIVPMDFTDHQFRGIHIANQLAHKFNAVIDIVYFLMPNSSSVGLHPKEAVLLETNNISKRKVKHLEEEASEKLNAIMTEMVDRKRRGRCYVAYSGIEATVKDIFSKLQPDLVVVGNNGTEYSFSDKALRSLISENIPVISTSSSKMDVQNVLIPTDLSKELPNHIYDLAEFMSRVCNVTIHLANVITTDLITDKEVQDKLHELANHTGLIKYQTHIVRNPDEMEGIAVLVDHTKADLVLMKTYAKSDFWTFLSGSVAEKAAQKLDQTVLVEQLK